MIKERYLRLYGIGEYAIRLKVSFSLLFSGCSRQPAFSFPIIDSPPCKPQVNCGIIGDIE
ncbi:hypothetical protein B5E77_00325 [Lachnoclostridium sp. An131]|nr:hypothetical protein B5E77_00325 [Lachnoclostridium sp. An131]